MSSRKQTGEGASGHRRLAIVMSAIAVLLIILIWGITGRFRRNPATPGKRFTWRAPDTLQIPLTPTGDLIRYGMELISHTASYLGPRGKVLAISNGMNCQNCHLEGGTRLWGNNYSAVYSTYPKFRDRSGSVEDIYKRVNDCIERSLNGTALDTNSREMQAIYAYIKWVGQSVPTGVKPAGAGIRDIPFISRAADPDKGKIVYIQKCQRCHGAQGAGLFNTDSTQYVYPPLWGEHSFNTGAGLYRISRFAGYVKDNMPFDASVNNPHPTAEESWDVAAFVLSQPHPYKSFSLDWPVIARKPFDHPFGPYADSFSEQQHKYGPFAPIRDTRRR